MLEQLKGGNVMSITNKDKEVYFDEYCPKCIHKDNEETDDPCWDCLREATNVNSHKPVYFEEDV